MTCLTGDTHGDFSRLRDFCNRIELTNDDTLIILGDAGFNYYEGERDRKGKELANTFGPVIFCIHGNHEIRPGNISSYKTRTFHGGQVYFEEEYPSIVFAIDGEIYNFEGNRCIAIGGAYSVDKEYRLARGYGWWADEQPSLEIKNKVESTLSAIGWNIDIVLSHTCPLKYEPTEVFLSFISQSTVDKSTEEWLDTIEDRLTYKKWYCGHYHTAKTVDKMEFMFEDYDIVIPKEGTR